VSTGKDSASAPRDGTPGRIQAAGKDSASAPRGGTPDRIQAAGAGVPEVSRQFPLLFVGLVVDSTLFPPGDATVADAVARHREHRSAWYAPLVGALLVPPDVAFATDGSLSFGVVGDRRKLDAALAYAKRPGVRRLDVTVAMRGEDPQPGVSALLRGAADAGDLEIYAEVPLTWGLSRALDDLAEARTSGVRVAAKFRVGGLAAELFPTPVELAAVLCACRDRNLPFALAPGLYRAVRHSDAETGFTHHGFLNVLAATLACVEGAEVAAVAERLAGTDALSLVEAVRPQLSAPRPLWTSFDARGMTGAVGDLTSLGLLYPPEESTSQVGVSAAG